MIISNQSAVQQLLIGWTRQLLTVTDTNLVPEARVLYALRSKLALVPVPFLLPIL